MDSAETPGNYRAKTTRTGFGRDGEDEPVTAKRKRKVRVPVRPDKEKLPELAHYLRAGDSELELLIRDQRAEIIEQLGGEAHVSAVKRHAIDAFLENRVLAQAGMRFLVRRGKVLNQKRAAFNPVAISVASMNRFLVSMAHQLGLDVIPQDINTLEDITAAALSEGAGEANEE